MAKKDGKRVSDLVNAALKSFLDDANNGHNGDSSKETDPAGFILRNDGEITLSKRDILGLKRAVGKFRIENTGRLVFEKDIDKEALKNIENIAIRAGTVEVPRTVYPYFLLKSEIHGKLEKY